MCWDFFKRVVVFSMSCAKRDPPFRAHLDHFSRLPKLMSGFLCQQEVKFEKSHFEILCNDFLYIWTYPWNIGANDDIRWSGSPRPGQVRFEFSFLLRAQKTLNKFSFPSCDFGQKLLNTFSFPSPPPLGGPTSLRCQQWVERKKGTFQLLRSTPQVCKSLRIYVVTEPQWCQFIFYT